MNIAIFKDTILYSIKERSKRILAAKKKRKSFFYLICKSQSLPDSSRRRIRNLGSEMKTVLSTVSMCESLLRTHDTLKYKNMIIVISHSDEVYRYLIILWIVIRLIIFPSNEKSIQNEYIIFYSEKI